MNNDLIFSSTTVIEELKWITADFNMRGKGTEKNERNLVLELPILIHRVQNVEQRVFP